MCWFHRIRRALGPGVALALVACTTPDTARSTRVPDSTSRPPLLLALPAAPPLVPPHLAAPEPEPEPDPGPANLDPEDDDEVGPPEAIADCAARLEAAGVRFRDGRLPSRITGNGVACGAPQAVVYERGPTGIRWNAPPVGTCALALGLARFEQIVQEEAARELRQGITRIVQGGTYSCRKMARFRIVSEHSYGNAIDIHSFSLENGRSVSVLRHFGKLDAEATTPESRFLRAIARRAFDEDVFSVVLTPYWDALHANHFHLDQARYRVDATRPRP